jgi:hypothetical protein
MKEVGKLMRHGAFDEAGEEKENGGHFVLSALAQSDECPRTYLFFFFFLLL